MNMDIKNKYDFWLNHNNLSDSDKKVLTAMSEDEIEQSFFKDISFGTGGIRGVVGIGSNRLNKYNIKRVNCGFAKYLLNEVERAKENGVVIAHDNRHMSEEFAKISAETLASFGIKVFLFPYLQATPILSFAVRYLKAAGGIVITASHNPREYNGYKLYNVDGCQLVPRETDLVIDYVNNQEHCLDIETGKESAVISYLDDEVENAYIKMVQSVSLSAEKANKDFKIIYSSQHGTGYKPMSRLLDEKGYNVTYVKEQCYPDPDFTNTESPNPEDAKAYTLAIEYAKKESADIILTTDPDSDRVGVACKNDSGDYTLINGNQMGALLLDYIVTNGDMGKNPYAVTTIVTSSLCERICSKNGIDLDLVLTGFKFIGDKIKEYEDTDKNFLLGYEESYGYLVSPEVRDKDAFQAGYLICEMASEYKKAGVSLLDKLTNIYETYGYFSESLVTVKMDGAAGMDRIDEIMTSLREFKADKIGGIAVKETVDYTSSSTGLPSANVMKFFLDDGSFVAFRPSGTEPKFKVYYSICGESKDECDQKTAILQKDVSELFFA